jgi:hypothetical protein
MPFNICFSKQTDKTNPRFTVVNTESAFKAEPDLIPAFAE